MLIHNIINNLCIFQLLKHISFNCFVHAEETCRQRSFEASSNKYDWYISVAIDLYQHFFVSIFQCLAFFGRLTHTQHSFCSQCLLLFLDNYGFRPLKFLKIAQVILTNDQLLLCITRILTYTNPLKYCRRLFTEDKY